MKNNDKNPLNTLGFRINFFSYLNVTIFSVLECLVSETMKSISGYAGI